MFVRRLVFLLVVQYTHANGPCADHAKQCGAWAARGECTKNQEHMRRTCPKSCGACGADLEQAAELTSPPQPEKLASAQMQIARGSLRGLESELASQGMTSLAQVQSGGQLSLNLQQHRTQHMQEQQARQQLQNAQLPDPRLRPSSSLGERSRTQLQLADTLPAADRPQPEQLALPSQQAPAQQQGTLVAALREVTKCRAARVECQSELAKCTQGGASRLASGKALLQQEEPCIMQLQAARAAASKLTRDLESAREELANKRSSIKKLRQQLLQQQISARAGESNCIDRLSTADQACHGQIDKLRQQLNAIESESGTLRKKLQQKEAIEEAIEGRHSKLTQVYKTLESECQVELRTCKEAAARNDPATASPASPSLPPPHSTEQHHLFSCHSNSIVSYLPVVVALLLGMYIGNGFKPPRTLARKWLSGGASTRRTHVEELCGWMPPNVSCSFESDMKIS